MNPFDAIKSATVFACLWLATTCVMAQEVGEAAGANDLKIMTWNIWHGGREDGEQLGPQRVVEVIKQSEADIIAMQETYGSGEIVSQGLGFHYQSRGTNLSIHSRYKIVEDISVFEEFKCVGSLIELPNGHRVAFYCLWLPYSTDIWLPDSRKGLSADELQEACEVSANDLQAIRDAIHERLSGDAYQGVSLILAGDFNSMSHLDYTPATLSQYALAVEWKTSHVLLDESFRDAYRETTPLVDRAIDSTWSPRFPEQEQDRIDYVYYRSPELRAFESRVIREHAVQFPSDHAALLVTFRQQEPQTSEPLPLRALSYNIRRGLGADERTDLSRTAAVIRSLEPDFVGLQEVDLGVERSGNVNQPQSLSRELGMHVAFAPFLEFQNGRYGMAVLSKHPIREAYGLELPDGLEPRVALIVKILLPNDQKMTLVNVHFDWDKNDRFRFLQATRLAEFLVELDEPYVLLGDFNDTSDSRTLGLFHALAVEADKPEDERMTWPARLPETEIDFIFAAPRDRWNVGAARVVEEKTASDHRPVVAVLEYKSE